MSMTGETTVTQCINIGPSVTYYFGLIYKSYLFCQTGYYSAGACGGSYISDGAILGDPNGVSGWTPRSVATSTPTGTASMQVSCTPWYGLMQIDKIYVNTNGDSF
jgi:hypothetical protein